MSFQIEKKKEKSNSCCHYCRISKNRPRGSSVKYLKCGGCRFSFCSPCVETHLLLDFERTKQDPNWRCFCCRDLCCCRYHRCPMEGVNDHQHCFTYRRTQKRHSESIPKWTKRKRDMSGAITPPRRRRENSGSKVDVRKGSEISNPVKTNSNTPSEEWTQDVATDYCNDDDDSYSEKDSDSEYEFNSDNEQDDWEDDYPFKNPQDDSKVDRTPCLLTNLFQEKPERICPTDLTKKEFQTPLAGDTLDATTKAMSKLTTRESKSTSTNPLFLPFPYCERNSSTNHVSSNSVVGQPSLHSTSIGKQPSCAQENTKVLEINDSQGIPARKRASSAAPVMSTQKSQVPLRLYQSSPELNLETNVPSAAQNVSNTSSFGTSAKRLSTEQDRHCASTLKLSSTPRSTNLQLCSPLQSPKDDQQVHLPQNISINVINYMYNDKSVDSKPSPDDSRNSHYSPNAAYVSREPARPVSFPMESSESGISLVFPSLPNFGSTGYNSPRWGSKKDSNGSLESTRAPAPTLIMREIPPTCSPVCSPLISPITSPFSSPRMFPTPPATMSSIPLSPLPSPRSPVITPFPSPRHHSVTNHDLDAVEVMMSLCSPTEKNDCMEIDEKIHKSELRGNQPRSAPNTSSEIERTCTPTRLKPNIPPLAFNFCNQTPQNDASKNDSPHSRGLVDNKSAPSTPHTPTAPSAPNPPLTPTAPQAPLVHTNYTGASPAVSFSSKSLSQSDPMLGQFSVQQRPTLKFHSTTPLSFAKAQTVSSSSYPISSTSMSLNQKFVGTKTSLHQSTPTHNTSLPTPPKDRKSTDSHQQEYHSPFSLSSHSSSRTDPPSPLYTSASPLSVSSRSSHPPSPLYSSSIASVRVQPVYPPSPANVSFALSGFPSLPNNTSFGINTTGFSGNSNLTNSCTKEKELRSPRD